MLISLHTHTHIHMHASTLCSLNSTLLVSTLFASFTKGAESVILRAVRFPQTDARRQEVPLLMMSAREEPGLELALSHRVRRGCSVVTRRHARETVRGAFWQFKREEEQYGAKVDAHLIKKYI